MKNDCTNKVECAGGIIINDQKEVVIVNQNNDSWSLPKGHIDNGETPIQAAKREIYEETGIKKLEYIRSLGSYQRYKIGLDGTDDLSELKTIYIYLFTTSQTTLTPIDPHNPYAKWIKYNEVENYLTHREDIKFFNNSLKLWI